MKDHDHLRAFGEIDDRFVEEAAPGRRVRRTNRWVALVAACLSLVLLIPCGVYLFTPLTVEQPPALSEFEGNDYYPLIELLYDFTPQKPAYANNFEKLIAYAANNIGLLFEHGANLGGAMGNAPTDDAPTHTPGGDEISTGGEPGEYVEITDNQVAGVIEADIIKRSTTHIYYLCDRTLYVYRIDGENTERVGEYTVKDEATPSYLLGTPVDMYLSPDDTTATLVYQSYSGYVKVVSLNVTDPDNIREENSMLISGKYTSSRSVDGKLMLVTEFFPGRDYEDESSFVPQIDRGNGPESIPLDSILYPDKLTARRYTVVCQVDQATLAYEGSAAFLSYSSENLFVSGTSIYTTRTYSKQIDRTGGVATSKEFTDICRLSFGPEGFRFHDPLTVEGRVRSRYFLDERDGILRVVTETKTTTGIYQINVDENGNEIGLGKPLSLTSTTNANIYCIDLATGTVIGKMIAFAPSGETVESVRFDATHAYVCTAKVVVLTDPIFFFDLSDPRCITYTRTDEIDGYSSSLVDMGNGFLLGIGVGEERGSLKIEVYEEDCGRVVSVCSYEIQSCEYSQDYHAYYIDRKNGLVGLGVFYKNGKNAYCQNYLLLYFDGYDLHELINVPLDGYYGNQRGVYIDGYFYMFGADEYKVIPLTL